MLGRSILTIIPPERRTEEADILLRLKRGERIDHYETVRMRKDGSLVPVSLSISPVKDGQGRIIGASKIARDISQSVRQREALEASLKEKEVLLREIHHRVKNNLQVVSSLLSLQSGYVEDPRLRDMLQDSQNRIKSMSLVHEKLYQAGDLAQVNLADYLASLIEHFRLLYANKAIRYDVATDPVMLSIDVAIPCALTAQELVTNALKHAFPGDRPGLIRVRLRRADGDGVLSIMDDGIGLPAGIDAQRAGSLGLALVRDLVQQVRGTAAMDRSGGTAWTITFPLKSREES
jgi:two-component sensor histidine kinase